MPFKKSILILSSVMPYPLDNGGAVRIYHLCKLLSEKYDFYLIADVENEIPLHLYQGNLPFFKEIVPVYSSGYPGRLKIFHPYPRDVLYHRRPFFKKALKVLLERRKYDLIQVDYAQCGHYFPLLPKNVPRLIVAHDACIKSYQRLYKILPFGLKKVGMLVEYWKMKLYEGFVYRKYDLVITLSKSDEELLSQIFPQLRFETLPQGVDCQFFKPLQEGRPFAPSLIFVGNFKHLPNLDCAQILLFDLFPTLKKDFPELKCILIGGNLPPSFNLEKDVIYTGFIGDIRPYFKPGAVFVAPIRLGAGMRSKILEAMAMGVPVVASEIAFEGIEIKDGISAFIANCKEDLVEKIKLLLGNINLYRQISEQASSFVLKNHCWSKIAEKQDEIYTRLLKR